MPGLQSEEGLRLRKSEPRRSWTLDAELDRSPADRLGMLHHAAHQGAAWRVVAQRTYVHAATA